MRDFLRSEMEEQVVVLPAPDMRDAVDYECPATPQKVRLVRHVASTGRVRVLMTNLLDTAYICNKKLELAIRSFGCQIP